MLRSQPNKNGPIKPPRLPIELISPIEAAAAESVREILRVRVAPGIMPKVVTMVVTMVMTMFVMITQPPGADQVYEEPHYGDRNRFAVVNRLRLREAFYRLKGHEGRYAEEEQGAAVATQHLDLPGAKRKAPVAGLASCE